VTDTYKASTGYITISTVMAIRSHALGTPW